MTAMAQHLSPFQEVAYTPDRDIVKGYHKLAAAYLSVMYGHDYEHILELCREVFIPNENGFKEAKFKVFKKNKVGDRVPTVMTAREFFGEVEEKNYHLSPSLVAYTNTNDEQSVNAKGTEQFIDFRRLYKGKMKQAIAVSDKEAAQAFNEIQNALKIFNNAQSGGMSSSGTPLYNKSGHTSLTSFCRSLTSTANMLNERLITGNRLLLSYDKAMDLFISTLAHARRGEIAKVIKKYKMNYATIDQCMDMVRRCASYYWNDPTKLNAIENFFSILSPLELTIVLCSMDIRGLYVTNPELMKQFFSEWCHIPELPTDLNENNSCKPANSDYEILCVTKMGKKATKDQIAALNAYHIGLEVKWDDFIRAFLKADIPPSGMFDVKELVRENVLTSDTDSMIYSVDMIIDDFVDQNDLDMALSFNGVLTYFIRSIAVDQHARLSSNMNVAKKYLYRPNMKNEYLFSSYVTTSMSKHYFALQLMLEGILYDVPKLELKGVHLRGVKIALKVREFTGKLMRSVLDAIYDRKQIDPAELLAEIADIERSLIEEIESGGYSWLTKNTIKEESAYSNPASSIFFYHEIWEEVFAGRYGDAPTLPYKAYKVNLSMSNKTKMRNYFDSMKGTIFGEKLEKALESRNNLTSVYIPVDMISGMGGIPKEILPVVDTRLIISQNLKSIYAILEALGLYILNGKTTRLVSDEH